VFGLAGALLLRALIQGAGAAAAPLARTRAALREDCEALAGAISQPREAADEATNR